MLKCMTLIVLYKQQQKNPFPQHLNGDHFLTSSYLYFN